MTTNEKDNESPNDDAGLYVISVAAELSGLHPQTLRQYDRLGLVSPNRTIGRNRRYSLRDIASLRMVGRLVAGLAPCLACLPMGCLFGCLQCCLLDAGEGYWLLHCERLASA
jgi:hypothetical protein